MDKSYYFVLEPNGADEGPYVLSEIRRRIELGLLTKSVALCRVGETDYVPVTDERYAKYMEPPRRVASGTQPLIVQKPAVDAKPADTPPTLEALSASLNAAATVVDATPKVPAQVIDVAPIAAASLTAIDGASSTALSIEVHEASASASAIDIDAVTVETTPVPRVDIDLVDAPTSLDPVSGMIEDIAATGPFDAVPSMMIDDAPVEAMPPGFMPPAIRRLEAPRMTDVSRAVEVRVPRPAPLPPAKRTPLAKNARIAIAIVVALAVAAAVLVAT